MAFSFIKVKLDENRAKYEERCKKNAENAKARNGKQESDSEQSHPIEANGSQIKPTPPIVSEPSDNLYSPPTASDGNEPQRSQPIISEIDQDKRTQAIASDCNRPQAMAADTDNDTDSDTDTDSDIYDDDNCLVVSKETEEQISQEREPTGEREHGSTYVSSLSEDHIWVMMRSSCVQTYGREDGEIRKYACELYRKHGLVRAVQIIREGHAIMDRSSDEIWELLEPYCVEAYRRTDQGMKDIACDLYREHGSFATLNAIYASGMSGGTCIGHARKLLEEQSKQRRTG